MPGVFSRFYIKLSFFFFFEREKEEEEEEEEEEEFNELSLLECGGKL